jgi:hypothetical protein
MEMPSRIHTRMLFESVNFSAHLSFTLSYNTKAVLVSVLSEAAKILADSILSPKNDIS